MTLGIILTILGICLTILGIILLTKNSKKIGKSIETVPTKTKVEQTEKQKGYDFEKYIVQKFSKNYFSVVEWTGDKYVNGTYAQSNTHPDLALKFKFKDVDFDFAVECKYRSNYYKNGIEWCSNRQLENYRNYAKDKQRTVFIAIGVKGIAINPDELFIIPLAEITSNFINKSFLSKYKKEKIKDSNLFYDYQSGQLK